MDAKAEVNKATSRYGTPLYRAITNNHPEIAALLREAGAREPTALELQQMEQEKAQENAMRLHRTEIAALLREVGAHE